MQALSDLLERLTALEGRVARMVRHGVVAQVDVPSGMVRIKIGSNDTGGDLLGPWVPYAQFAGAAKVHLPPSVGQQMTMIAPGGDWEQALAVPATWSINQPSPSISPDENVLTFGGIKLAIAPDSVVVVAGSVSFTISPSGVDISGGSVTHNGVNIGSSHVHGGVQVGGGDTSTPQ